MAKSPYFSVCISTYNDVNETFTKGCTYYNIGLHGFRPIAVCIKYYDTKHRGGSIRTTVGLLPAYSPSIILTNVRRDTDSMIGKGALWPEF